MKTKSFGKTALSTTILALMMVVLLSPGRQYAQGGQGNNRGGATPEERAHRITDRMKDGLNLTEAQVKKVYAINLKYANMNEKLKNSTDTAQARKTLQSNNKLRDSEFKTVLTPTQFTEYQKMAADMKKRRQGEGTPKTRP